MYRSAAKRLLHFTSLHQTSRSQIRTLTVNLPRFSTSAPSDSVPNQSPKHFDTASSSSSSSSSASEEERYRSYESQTSRGTRPRVHYEEEQARVLNASLHHVVSNFSQFPFPLLLCLQTRNSVHICARFNLLLV